MRRKHRTRLVLLVQPFALPLLPWSLVPPRAARNLLTILSRRAAAIQRRPALFAAKPPGVLGMFNEELSTLQVPGSGFFRLYDQERTAVEV